MGKSVCYGIFDSQTGLWLTGYNEPVQNCTWGNEEDAVCFNSEAKRDEVLAELNLGAARFIGQNPRPR